MRRREFITLIGGAAAAWPFTVRAQQGERMRRIGILLATTADDVEFQAWVGAFLQALALLGWTIGRNVRIDTRWAGAKADDIRKHAAELAALAPDVILAHGASTVGALLQATRTVPIVFPIVSDPVAQGFVESMARPGGNATGFTSFDWSVSAKWLELLKQTAPGVTRAAVLRDATQGSGSSQFGVIQAAAPSLGGQAGQHARRRGDRARRHGLCALSRRRPDRGGGPGRDAPSRFDRQAGGSAQTARGLLRTLLRRRRRPDLVRL
jgi:putative ABC transport system substrate-binding protein